MQMDRGEGTSLQEVMRREERPDYRGMAMVGLMALGAFFWWLWTSRLGELAGRERLRVVCVAPGF
jgi:hypothetical protein